MKEYLFLLVLFLAVTTITVTAQTDSTVDVNGALQELDPELKLAIRHITQLRGEGLLLIRMPGKFNKEVALRQKVEGKRSTRLLEKLKSDRTHYCQVMSQAFREQLSFTDFRIIWDSTQVSTLRQGGKALFLNEHCECESGHPIAMGRPLYFLRIGKSPIGESTRRTGWIFTDESGAFLEKPFPYFTEIFMRTVVANPASLFSNNFMRHTDELAAQKITGSLQRKLEQFYAYAIEYLPAEGGD